MRKVAKEATFVAVFFFLFFFFGGRGGGGLTALETVFQSISGRLPEREKDEK